MAVRHIVKGENGYRLVFRDGLVWTLRGDGSVAHVSSWQPCCPAHVSIAAGTLAAITTADWMARRAV
jgi:hypothetical protein